MGNLYSWDKSPNTKSPVIKLFRNFCSDELSSELVYKNGYFFKDWFIDIVIKFVKENGSNDEIEKTLNLYRKNLKDRVSLPFASTIHEFLKKNDSIWYEEVYNRNYKLLMKKDDK